MQVRIKGYLTFRMLLADQVLEFSDTQPVTLQNALEVLLEERGERLREAMLDGKSGLLRRQVAILVNGVHYTQTPTRLETLLKDGDIISIFPPISGGTEDRSSKQNHPV